MSRITAITPSQRSPEHASIKVDGRFVATLSIRLIAELGLKVGQPWDTRLAGAVDTAAAHTRAMKQAMSLLNRRPYSQAMLARKLRDKGHDPQVVEQAIDRLSAVGTLDDEAYAQLLVRELLRQKPAGARLIVSKLRQKGIAQDLAQRIADQACGQDDAIQSARQLAQRKLRSLQRFDPRTRQRRLWGMLARRGFDGSTIEVALRDLVPDDNDSDA